MDADVLQKFTMEELWTRMCCIFDATMEELWTRMCCIIYHGGIVDADVLHKIFLHGGIVDADVLHKIYHGGIVDADVLHKMVAPWRNCGRGCVAF